MSELAILPLVADTQPIPSAAGAGRKPSDPTRDDPTKIRDAAQQFEALLLSQMLHTARESTGNWLSSGEDSSGDCATDFAEQQFAAAMAQQGGIGLADLIARSLKRS